MQLHSKIKQLRPYPERVSIATELLISLGVILLGALLGYIAKATDGSSLIGDIGTELGVWIFIATLIAVYSRYPISAAINVMLFFLAMLATYYLYGHLVLGFFPRAYFMAWLAVALLSPIAGFVAWFAKAEGMLGALVTALPVSFLFSLGYAAFYTYKITLILTLAYGVVLNLLLPKTLRHKAITFGASVVLAFLISAFRLVSWLAF